MQTREEEYLAEAGQYDRDELQLFAEAFAALTLAMDAEPFTDLMGPIYMEWSSRSSQKWGGEFYTPHDVCKLMAKCTLGGLQMPQDRPLSICEPACGAGAMMLATVGELVELGYSPINTQVTCIDISRLACDMCYINMTLWGIPATVIHGNTLSLETWGGWRNCWWGVAKPVDPLTDVLSMVRQMAAVLSAAPDEMPF